MEFVGDTAYVVSVDGNVYKIANLLNDGGCQSAGQRTGPRKSVGDLRGPPVDT